MNILKTSGFPQALLALFLVLAAAPSAFAHALGAECSLRGDRVEVEAYYDDDTPARDARVIVRDVAKKSVTEGRTNDKGFWSFPRPEPGRYRITVDAGAGHRTTVTITVPGTPPAGSATADASRQGEQATVKLSEGPGRAEFTRVPWLKVGIGIGAIGGLGLATWGMLRLRRLAARQATGTNSVSTPDSEDHGLLDGERRP